MYGNTKLNRNTNGNRMKRFKKHDMIILLLVIFSALFVMGKDTILQEGNPLQYVKAIFMLAIGDEYAQAERAGAKGEQETVFLTKKADSEALFSYVEDTYQVKFKEQIGGGYIFEGESENRVLTGRIYLKYFTIWTISLWR
jgi:hypothetical protein